jgi:hypothetical protein
MDVKRHGITLNQVMKKVRVMEWVASQKGTLIMQ